MADEPENMTLVLLREMRTEMREGFAELRGELKAFREEVAATDDENAKVLETITHDLADLKTIFVDLQARVVRTEKRVKALEDRRPQ